MKKTTILLFGLTAFSLASCTEEESVNIDKGFPIEFRSAVGTRAEEITNANLSEITVSAFLNNQDFFLQLPFKKDLKKGSEGYFSSDTEYYWPGDDSEISFYAYSPAAPGGTVTLNHDTKTLTDFSPATAIEDQVDFISTDEVIGKKTTNEASGVELTFNHRLSQIEVQAKADNPAYIFKISGVRIGQPLSKGSFDFTTNTWTLGADKDTYEETYSDQITLTADPVSIMGSEGNAMLIPQQLTAWQPDTDAADAQGGAYLSVRLQINTADGAQVFPFQNGATWAAIPISTNWEPGKKYVYVLDFSHGGGNVDPKDPDPGEPILGGPIHFKVNVTSWASAGDNTDIPMEIKNNQ